MLLKLLCLALIVTSLTSCLHEPPEPEIQICAPVFDDLPDGTTDLANSTVFCISDLNPGDKTKQHSYPFLDYMLNNKPFMTTPEDYQLKTSWGAQLKSWGETHCK